MRTGVSALRFHRTRMRNSPSLPLRASVPCFIPLHYLLPPVRINGAARDWDWESYHVQSGRPLEAPGAGRSASTPCPFAPLSRSHFGVQLNLRSRSTKPPSNRVPQLLRFFHNPKQPEPEGDGAFADRSVRAPFYRTRLRNMPSLPLRASVACFILCALCRHQFRYARDASRHW